MFSSFRVSRDLIGWMSYCNLLAMCSQRIEKPYWPSRGHMFSSFIEYQGI